MHDPVQTLITIACSTLGLKQHEIDPEANILELGLDSLMIIKLAQEIERRFGVTLDAGWFLTTMPSLHDLARHVGPLPAEASDPQQEYVSDRPSHPQPPADQPARLPDRCISSNAPASLTELYAVQLRTMKDLFARQLQTLHAATGQRPVCTEAASSAEKQPASRARLQRNLRGFVLETTALDTNQAAFVENLVQRHVQRTQKSSALGRRSAVLADWKSSLSFRPELRATAYPIVADSTYGGRFRDVDGNEYIDIAVGMGVHYLGHNPPYVVAALRNRLDRGFGLGPQCDRTAAAAEGISRLTGMERISFCNTGSEAVMFALRLARAKTGRPLIALFNGAYHGTFDGVLAASENGHIGTYSPGTPLGMVEDVLVLDYNSDAAFETLDSCWQDVAAVLVEPVQSRKPGLQPQTFLRRLRRYTKEKDICLIFDEMVNGFRCAPGGAQEHFGIRSDMALYGKVAGGGLPVGIVAGSRDYLDYIDGGFLGSQEHPQETKTIVFGGTFCRHPLSMEGVCAATDYLLQQGPELQAGTFRLTTRLADRLNLWFQDNQVPLRLTHFGPQFLFEGYGPYNALANPIELPLFYLLLMERGVYTWERRTCGLCTEHTEDDIRQIETAVRESVLALRDGGFTFTLDRGTPQIFTPMTPTEERLYAIFQRDHGQDAYHLPLAWEIREDSGSLDVEELEICLGQCIRRHEALRSSFLHIEDRLVRKVVDEPIFTLERIDPAGRSTQEILSAFVRPFDLEQAPLMRAGLGTREDGSHLFMLDVLHIAVDGASLGILLEDLNAFMNGHRPAAQLLPLKDVQALSDTQRAEEDIRFWTERLRDMPSLELPLDYPSRSGSPLGRQEWMTLDTDLTASAHAACRTLSVTMNMFLNGVYALFLHKITTGTRFCVGMAEGGRHDERMAPLMGMFVNTVPQIFDVHPEWTLREFLSSIRLSCAESMDHNRAPYGELVRQLDRSPAATMLSYEKGDQRRPDWPGLQFSAEVPPGSGAMYDFAIDIVEMDGVLHCNLLSSEAMRPDSARCFGECFAHLVRETARLASSPAVTVRDLSALPDAQARKVLHDWQGEDLPFDQTRTIVHLCLDAARTHAAKTALVFQDQRLSYGDLDRCSAALAQRLVAVGAGREQVVAIRLDRSLEFIVAVLGILRSGAAFLPLAPEAPTERIAYQISDAAPCALISTGNLRPAAEHFQGAWIDAAALLSTEPDPALPQGRDPEPADLAYVIYTSGTTGQPKGVMIEHRNLASLCHWFVRNYSITAADRTTAYAPFIFDASIWEYLPMLMQGATVHIFDSEIRRDMPAIHAYLRRERITVTYFLSQVSEMIDGASLPDLRLMLCGGEVMRIARPAGCYRHSNAYGPTECTITTATFDLDGTWPVPIGRLVANTQGLILDTDGRPCPIGVPGELFLAGLLVGRGYLHRPDLTAAAFLANPFASPESPYARMYRTGDVCRWLPDGNIEFMGRADGQIKLRGHRIEPGEIERILLDCPGVCHAAVMVREENGNRLLCAYVAMADQDARHPDLRTVAAAQLPAYMVPDRFMVLKEMPLSGTGKVDKKALPPIPAAQGCSFSLPQTPEERMLAEIWTEQLSTAAVGRDDNFFDLGGDSIKALMVTSRVRARGYTMDAKDLFRNATIAALAPLLQPLQPPAERISRTAVEIPPADKDYITGLFQGSVEHILELAPLQQGIVFHSRLDSSSPAYVEQNLLRIRGALDTNAFRRRLDAAVTRHGMLRTVFVTKGVSRPWQVVLTRINVEDMLQEESLQGQSASEREDRIRHIMDTERHKGFDLGRPPLLRLRLLQSAPEEYLLLCTMHHAIIDGWSMGVFCSELFADTTASGSPLQFHDYLTWLHSQDEDAARQWWRDHLLEAEPSELPGFHPAKSAYRGERLPLPLDTDLQARLAELSAQGRITLNALLQTAWAIVLSRSTRHEDVIFGEIVSGRPPELQGVEHLVGLCANTVPVRVHCGPDSSFLETAAALQDAALTGLGHSFLPLTEIQAAAECGQDLLTHFFVLENYPPPRAAEDLQVDVIDEFSQTSFDFAVVWEQREGLQGFLVYNAASFESWRIRSLAAAYVAVLDAVSRTPDMPLTKIELLAQDARDRMLEEFRAPVVAWPEATVVQLLREVARRQPEAIALVCNGRTLSYSELDRRTDVLASKLRAQGVHRERIAAVLLHRGPLFAISLLAVLKAGGAFLPLAVDAPAKRLQFQLQDSGAVVLLSQGNLPSALELGLPWLDLDDTTLQDGRWEPLPEPAMTDLAYVIYTSGTTGQPKGVPVEHRSLTNQTLWTARQYGLNAQSRLTLFASHAFDVSIWELFPGLTAGSTLHVLDEDLRRDLRRLAAYLRDNAITDTWMPPHMAALFLKDETAPNLRTLTAGGDVFTPGGDYPFKLYNNYGPTECTITSTSCPDFARAPRRSIGSPVDNTDMYILDSQGHLLPPGLPGELCITGVQVARGYLNRPDQTVEAFVANPFGRDADTRRMYRTGDLCAWLPDGSIEFLGRIDQQIKIRGHRIEPAEIEKTIQGHPQVEQCAVRVEQGKIWAYAVLAPASRIQAGEIRSHAASLLPPYMTPDRVVLLDRLPLTASGKIDRKALPAPALLQEEFVPPRTEKEILLCSVMKNVLDVDRVGLEDDFFQLGGDSIKALIVASRLYAQGYELDLQGLYARMDLATLARSMRPVATDTAAQADWRDPLVPPSDRETIDERFEDIQTVCRLTPMQAAMLATCERIPSAYIIENWADIEGSLDPSALEKRWQELTLRHDALRTVFIRSTQQPWQVILRSKAPFFRFEDLHHLLPEAQEKRMHEAQASLPLPDLEQDPLVRLLLFRLRPDRWRMLLSWHHGILDGWSLGHVLGELLADNAPDQPAVSFLSHIRMLTEHDREASRNWWQEQLADRNFTSIIPHHSSMEGNTTGQTRELRFQPIRQVDARLRQLAGEHGLTLTSLLQAVWATVLARHTDAEDILFGSIDAGRQAAIPGVEHLVGLCVQTVPVRVRCSSGSTLLELASALQSWNQEARNHAWFSMTDLPAPAAEAMRQLFVMENQPPLASSGDLTITPQSSSGYVGADLALEWSDSGRLEGLLHYDAGLFADWRMEALRDHILTLLEKAVNKPDRPLDAMSMLSPAEERRILVHCNNTDVDMPEETAVDLFRAAARHHPERIAVAAADGSLSYTELDRQSDCLAAELHARGVARGQIVGVFMPRVSAFVTAALGVMKAGAAYLPLDPDWPLDRLAFITEDAGLSMVIDHPQTRDLPLPERLVRLHARGSDRTTLPPAPRPQDLAYVIYTSGSTGRPKGVLLEHGGLSNLCRWQHRDFPLTAVDTCTSYAPWTFDASVYEIFPALTAGATLHILPESLRMDVEALRGYLHTHQVSTAFLPPQVGHQVLDGHDFPYLHVVTLAGDKPGSLAPRPFDLRNCYGPTEFTVCATSWSVTAATTRPPIGPPIANSRCYIVGRHGGLQPFGAPGELCVSGVQTARGYLNRPQDTARAFTPNPFASGGPHARMYRTGDRCRLQPDGVLDFLGRLDTQIKLRGQRLELGEIETQLLRHPDVHSAVVLLHTQGKQTGLAAWVTPATLDGATLRAWLSTRLPAWMVPQHLMALDALPLTPNGKIDQQALPQPEQTAHSGTLPVSPAERAMADAWNNVLGIGSPVLEDSFFTLGGDSIKAMLIVSRLRAQGFQLTTGLLFEHPILREAAAAMGQVSTPETCNAGSAPRPTGRDLEFLQEHFGDSMLSALPLTPMQEGLLYHHTLAPHSPAYLEQTVLELTGSLEPDILARSLADATRRHGMLRTCFAWKGLTRPWQIETPDAAATLIFEDLQHVSPAAQQQHIASLQASVREHGLDLEHGPLLRLHLCRLETERHALLVSFQHIILDGWSMGLLAAELFGNEPLPAQPFSAYTDWLAGRDREAARAFWQDWLAGARPTHLPSRRAGSERSFENCNRHLDIDQTLATRLQAVAAEHHVTLNTLLQTAWAVVLSRATDGDEAVFGTVLSGRHADLPGIDRMIGLFVTTVPMRIRIADHPSLAHLLRDVQSAFLRMEPHSHLPLSDIQQLTPQGNALLTSLFVMENLPTLHGGTGLQIQSAGGFNQSEYDLALVFDHGHALSGRLQFNASVMDEGLVRTLGDCLVHVLRQMADNQDQSPAALQLPTPKFAAAPAATAETTVLDLFRDSVRRHGHRPAVYVDGHPQTYAELDARSDALAERLLGTGAGPDRIVGILLPRTGDAVTALLGVLKAGAAWLALDTAYPRERLTFMLEDAAPVALIGDTSMRSLLPDSDIPRIDITAPLPPASGAQPAPDPRSLAYVVYTSGTTGRPKGVMIEHRSLANFCSWHRDFYHVTEQDRFAHVFSFAFDASAWGIFPALSAGAAIHVLPDEDRTDSRRLRDAFEARGITMANIPTVLAEQFQDLKAPRSLRVLATGGGALRVYKPQPYGLFNEYGPSEATIMATCAHVVSADPPIPIGLPVAGTRALILNRNGQLQPDGLPGELHLSGKALARGYLGQPELSKLAFVPNPYGNDHPDTQRMYRTGDICRRLTDGSLEFLGRRDEQLGIRGFRIEPAEIEHALLMLPGVRAAAVIAVPDDNGENMLCAYVVAETWDDRHMQALLRDKLPAYMIPALFVRMQELPMTANGKLDHAALPRPTRARSTAGEPPTTALELALARIWEDVIGCGNIALDDDFFLTGGDSLKAVRLAARLESTLGCTMTTAELMGGVTIRSLAAGIRSGRGEWQPLVTIREGSGLPLVLVHGVGGSVLCYRDLIDALPEKHPIHILPVYGLEEGQTPDTSLAALAERYVPALTERFPGGDFLLVGLCMAGMTAWEVARQLHEAGCTVRGIISLNTRSQLLEDDLGRPTPPEHIPDDVPEEAITIGLQTVASYDGHAPSAQTQEHLRELLRAQLLAWGHYVPRPLPVTMTCIRPSDPVDGTYLPFETRPLGWSALALHGCEERRCPGNHFTMFKKPHARDMASMLDEIASASRSDTPGLPLTPIQQWFFELDMQHGQFFQSVVLRTDRHRTEQTYRKALDALALRHDMLRAVFPLQQGVRSQHVLDHAGGFGLRTCSPEELDAVAAEIAAGMDLERGPLAWAVFMPGSAQNEPDRLALMLHHLIVDGVSWRILQQDFTAALSCLDAGLPINLPSTPLAGDGTYADWAAHLHAFAVSPQLRDQIPFWTSMLAHSPKGFQDLPRAAKRLTGDLMRRTIHIDADTTRQMTGPCHKTFGTDINDLLLTALLLAAREWRGCDGLLVDLEGHGRQDIFDDISPAAIIGWFTTLHPVALHCAADAVATLKAVRDTLRKVPDKGLGFGLLRHKDTIRSLRSEDADVLFNYLGDTSGGSDGPLALERIGLPHDVGPDFPQQARLAVTGLVHEGSLELSVDAHPEEFSEEDISRLLETVRRQLQMLVALCMQEI